VIPKQAPETLNMNRWILLFMKYWLLLTVFLLLTLPSSASSYNITTQQEMKNSGHDHSLHLVLSGSKIWYVVKFNFSEDTCLERQAYYQLSMNHSSTDFIAEIFYVPSEPIFWYVWSSKIASPDRYFQYKIGPFYGYHSHIRNNLKAWMSGSLGTFACSTEINYPEYYIFISYMNSSSYDIWLNWTGNATISETQGTDVFAYERHDFTGNLNIGRRRGTFILNGEKDILVENTLFAWYGVSNCSTGRETLQYTTPIGTIGWRRYIDRRGEPIAINQSSSFFDNLWWGQSGTWKFSVNMFNRGLKRHTPDFYLIGADVQLPN
jgi:hypothetical protein